MNFIIPRSPTLILINTRLGGDSIDILGMKLGTKLGTIYRNAFWDVPQYGTQFGAQFRAQNVN